jgi:hypothetical protein
VLELLLCSSCLRLLPRRYPRVLRVHAERSGHDIARVSGHELLETITDPTGGGWYDDVTFSEIGDPCEWSFLTGVREVQFRGLAASTGVCFLR